MKVEWKRAIRTVVQVVIPTVIFLPEIIDAAGISDALPWVAAIGAVAGGLARVMALPKVQKLLLWLNTEEDTDR